MGDGEDREEDKMEKTGRRIEKIKERDAPPPSRPNNSPYVSRFLALFALAIAKHRGSVT